MSVLSISAAERRCRLIMLGYAKQVSPHVKDKKILDAVNVALRFIDGKASRKELSGAKNRAWMSRDLFFGDRRYISAARVCALCTEEDTFNALRNSKKWLAINFDNRY